MGLSQVELAEKMGVSYPRVNELHGNLDKGLKLLRAFFTPPNSKSALLKIPPTEFLDLLREAF